jgi:hypothetical protein
MGAVVVLTSEGVVFSDCAMSVKAPVAQSGHVRHLGMLTFEVGQCLPAVLAKHADPVVQIIGLTPKMVAYLKEICGPAVKIEEFDTVSV